MDLCVITAQGVDYLRNHQFLQDKTYTRQFPVHYPAGTASGWRVCVRACVLRWRGWGGGEGRMGLAHGLGWGGVVGW